MDIVAVPVELTKKKIGQAPDGAIRFELRRGKSVLRSYLISGCPESMGKFTHLGKPVTKNWISDEHYWPIVRALRAYRNGSISIDKPVRKKAKPKKPSSKKAMSQEEAWSVWRNHRRADDPVVAPTTDEVVQALSVEGADKTIGAYWA